MFFLDLNLRRRRKTFYARYVSKIMFENRIILDLYSRRGLPKMNVNYIAPLNGFKTTVMDIVELHEKINPFH